MQFPLMQVWPFVHVVAQVPQWVLSVLGSMQVPLHRSRSEAQMRGFVVRDGVAVVAGVVRFGVDVTTTVGAGVVSTVATMT